MSERREASRIVVNLPVRYSSGQVSMSGRVSNLSRNGLFMHSERVDRAGADVTLSLVLPGENPIELLGQVVRVVAAGSRRAGMAIRFLSLADGVRRRLANYMIERSYRALSRG